MNNLIQKISNFIWIMILCAGIALYIIYHLGGFTKNPAPVPCKENRLLSISKLLNNGDKEVCFYWRIGYKEEAFVLMNAIKKGNTYIIEYDGEPIEIGLR
jgi:hypothetical protein